MEAGASAWEADPVVTDCARFSRTQGGLQCAHHALTSYPCSGDMPGMTQARSLSADWPAFSDACLSLRAVSLSRGERRLIEALDLDCRAGDAIFLIGVNGAGKTTLLRAIAGFLALDAGEIALPGDREDVIAWLGHADGLKPNETLRQALRFWCAQSGESRRNILPFLKALDIGHLIDRPAGRLSRGQQRRAALARIALANRPIWLLDEPAGPLDGAGRDRLAELVGWHRARGGLVLAATHQMLDWPGARTLEIGA